MPPSSYRDVMGSLVALISASLEERKAAEVETLVFGSSDPEAIANTMRETCIRHLGATVVGGSFYVVSVGCVAGVRLADDRHVVLKAHQPRWPARFLSAVSSVQVRLAEDGFPCARPITGPLPVGQSHIVVEEVFDDPGPSRVDPPLLGVSAAGLAGLISQLRRISGRNLLPHPMDRGEGELYPEPHSPIFDFRSTATGAEWIDELAATALQVRDAWPGPLTVAHCDWSLRNVRMSSDRVLAVYDWDSLALIRETTAVGQAAATWSSHDGGPEAAPSVEEIASYVEHYERARGQAFTSPERSMVGAAALYNLAYIARCEHAVDPQQERHRQARPRLAADGDRLLGLAALLA